MGQGFESPPRLDTNHRSGGGPIAKRRLRHVARALPLALMLASCTSNGAPRPPASPSPAVGARWSVLFAIPGRQGIGHLLYRYAVATGKTTVAGEDDNAGNGFVGSPDARLVARFSFPIGAPGPSSLAVAPARDLTRFTEIARESSGRIGQVLWSPDGSTLYYIVTSGLIDAGGTTNRLVAVRPDGTHRRIITTFTRPSFVIAVAADPKKNTLVWFETGDGGHLLRLSRVDLRTGRARQVPIAPPELLDTQIEVSRDGARAYHVKDRTHIMELALDDGTTREVLRERTSSTIDRLVLSPAGDRIAYMTTQKGARGSLTSVARTSDGTSTRVYQDARDDYVGPIRWTPDGTALWLETVCRCGKDLKQRLFLVDLGTKRTTGLPLNLQLGEFRSWLAG